MANLIVLHCIRCGQEFSVKPHLSQKAKYCSNACRYIRLPDRPCLVCEANIPRRNLPISSSRYCSQKCASIGQRGNHKPMIDRFWEKVDTTPGLGPDGDCWVWISPVKDRGGYGGLVEDGKLVRAHVYSYRVHKGDVPKGAFVCHKCDNPSCVRPEHLWLGDAASNNKDKMQKGRHRYLVGESVPVAKLSENQVRVILKDDRTHEVIAQEYGVHRATIGLIKTRKNWKHLQP